ncbi:MAG: L-fucose/L-arabinose isomerase family protein [Anaerolineae bacterium]
MSRQDLLLGLVPTRRNIFSRADALRQKRRIEEQLRAWNVPFANIDWLNEEGLLYDADAAPDVARRLREAGVGALLAPHCNFGSEDAVAQVARLVGKPFLLWGPRDEAPLPDGMRLRDTQCGLFATSKVLRRLGVPFTYVINSAVDSPVFRRGLHDFLGAAAAANAFLNARIGQLDTRPAAFWTVMCNEGELLERWGIQLVPTTLVDVERAVKALVERPTEPLKAAAEEIRTRVDLARVTEDELQRLAALKLALRAWAERERLDAIAIQCWDALQNALGLFPCFVDGLLTDEFLPVACETDVHGALTALMLQAAARYTTPIFFADLTVRHPEDDNAELLWHCGPFPLSLAEPESKPHITDNYIAATGVCGCGEWRIRGGDLTLARFDGDHGRYSLLMGHARGTQGPFTRGTYLWAQVNNWPLWEQKLVYGPYIHHIVGAHGSYAPALYEACKYIPGLEADPVEPAAAEIMAHWRGESL